MLRTKPETAVGLFILAAIAIFLYMSIQMGSFRLYKGSYNSYVLHFSDIAGLNKKADVKIAGIKVGWVENLELFAEQKRVCVSVMINKHYPLHEDAYGMVRQEGLLGTKFLEINTGSPDTPLLNNNGTLAKTSKESVSFEQLLSHIAAFSQRLDSLVEQNQSHIETTLASLRELIIDLKEKIPTLSHEIRQDFNRIANKVESTAHSFEKMMDSVDEGKGFIGQLMHDDDSYQNFRVATEGLKNYLTHIDRLSVIFDTHIESMHGFIQNNWVKDAKGYFNIRIYPTEDYFYLVGMVGTLSGTFHRYEIHRRWFNTIDNECQELIPAEFPLSDADKLRYAPLKQEVIRSFDMPTFNVQFGKIYNNLAVRFGIMENTIGVGLDLDVPFENENFRWVSTFELFDFRGRKRFADNSPHLKWFNRFFMTKNTFLVFGADDFISRNNKNTFFGVGLRFW